MDKSGGKSNIWVPGLIGAKLCHNVMFLANYFHENIWLIQAEVWGDAVSC